MRGEQEEASNRQKGKGPKTKEGEKATKPTPV